MAAANQSRFSEKIDHSNKQKSQSQEFISKYHKDLHEWSKNVDKRYAWVILAALWLTFGTTLGSYRIYGLVFAEVTTTGIYTRQEASWPVSMIFTTENIFGPITSIIAYHISYRTSMLIGGLLIILCNSLTYFSRSLLLDVLLIGVIQGFGYGFIFMPFMEVINSYFLKYRNIALGFSLCGGTMSVFILQPLFQWIIENYYWRTAYLVIGLLTCLNILIVPFLRPNPKPTPDHLKGTIGERATNQSSRMSMRALSYQNSIRRQSTILVRTNSTNERKISVISVNPFASTVGLERKISRAVMENSMNSDQTNSHYQQQSSLAVPRTDNLIDSFETKSLHDIEQETAMSSFSFSIILDIIKTPGFHVIWYLELTYYWIFSIYCLVLVDFGIDHGCNRDEAERLLMFQSVGEMIGRLGLTVLADMQFISCQSIVILNLSLMAAILCSMPYVNGFFWLSAYTIAINAFASLLYILLNGLLVSKLGERKVTIGYGLSSCVVGIFIIFRPHAVGFFRDYLGSYEWLMISLGMACAFGVVLCLLESLVSRSDCVQEQKNEDSQA